MLEADESSDACRIYLMSPTSCNSGRSGTCSSSVTEKIVAQSNPSISSSTSFARVLPHASRVSLTSCKASAALSYSLFHALIRQGPSFLLSRAGQSSNVLSRIIFPTLLKSSHLELRCSNSGVQSFMSAYIQVAQWKRSSLGCPHSFSIRGRLHLKASEMPCGQISSMSNPPDCQYA